MYGTNSVAPYSLTLSTLPWITDDLFNRVWNFQNSRSSSSQPARIADVIKLNGMAHIIINVSRWEECKAFYKKLMPFLGMEQVFDGQEYIYFVGSRTAVGINKCEPEYNEQVFQQERIGLHHFCLRSRSTEDVDAIYRFLLTINAKIVEKPKEGEWAPGYYFVLFEDPIGTRIEVNYVPGKGVLADDVGFTAGQHYR